MFLHSYKEVWWPSKMRCIHIFNLRTDKQIHSFCRLPALFVQRFPPTPRSWITPYVFFLWEVKWVAWFPEAIMGIQCLLTSKGTRHDHGYTCIKPGKIARLIRSFPKDWQINIAALLFLSTLGTSVIYILFGKGTLKGLKFQGSFWPVTENRGHFPIWVSFYQGGHLNNSLHGEGRPGMGCCLCNLPFPSHPVSRLATMDL